MLQVLFAAVLLGAVSITQAAEQPRPLTSVPGAPGSPTPTPYPQITPSMAPKRGDSRPGAPLLPPMPLPSPPKDQPLPGLNQVPSPGKDPL